MTFNQSGQTVHGSQVNVGLPDKVWVVYQPLDYQRANILGVYASEAAAIRALRATKLEARSEGDVNWSYISMTEMVLE